MAKKLKIIPLGGLNEIGKNMTAYEYGGEIMIVDCGIAFPDEEMLGVDLVIPDFTYLRKNAQKVRAVVLTHGHEDHIGALPYLLREMNIPIYCTRLTAGIIEIRLAEHKLLDKVKINRVEAGQTVNIGGCFSVEFIHVNHSIADAVALSITTPVGIVVQTGDFKLDTTPIQGEMMDIARLGALGNAGVLLLLADSTNVERPGYTMSERTVGEAFDNLFKGCDQRIIVATFASNVHRIQQIINSSVKVGRKVAISGRSMENTMKVGMQLGYINVDDSNLIDIASVNRHPKSKVTIITTGSQGEPMSALYRMAFSGHRQVEIGRGDRVIMSSSPIPGNEKTVYRVIDELFRKGAEVVYERLAEVHVSGHACQEELKLMLALTKPRFFMPVHGEFRHLTKHAELARRMGTPPEKIFIGDIGRVLEVTADSAKLGSVVPSGRVFIDGLGIGDVGAVVLRDRKHLSEDGLIVVVVTLDAEGGHIVAGPDIISRGFIYVKEAEDMMEELRVSSQAILEKCRDSGMADWASIKTTLKSELTDMLYKKTKRRPMILPVIMEV